MKCSYVLLATAGLAVAQQKFTDVVPKCSIECLTKAVKDGTKCSSIDDSACICEADNYRSIYTVGVNCVLQACGSDVAIGQLLPAAGKFCREVTGGASAPPVDSASASASAVVSSAIESLSSAAASASTAASNATASVSITATPTAGASSTAAAATTASQAGAAPAMASMGALGMLALGGLAAF
ncbi:uncharacterized protein CCOS01_10028 [Colletotrichum costaricense]|uniref:CFEM domain-containing protein n=1 Tax=Colletotrichum costaricense TaxID=1209916 RepID=A0AAI9YTJ1_9PEZI|nr:uncharacterized protein CCOS01_10028 [Colletotrichum costaricense]KAI3546656.1 hypothetical protein CSPX01_04311 [Colletotrichum filicis]KAK1522316.1 hypothetical protein CCOS01_10028 [Colletotrichum costaricense]